MKKWFVVALMLAVVTCAKSWDDPYGKSKPIIIRQGDVFKVIYPGPSKVPVQIFIFDKQGTEVYSETVNTKAGFIRPYNLSQLPSDDYKICIKDELGECTEKINTYVENKWAPRINKLDTPEEKYLISIPNEREGKATISIYDADSHLLYQNEVATTEGFATVFHLKDLVDGAVFNLFNHTTGEVFSYVTK